MMWKADLVAGLTAAAVVIPKAMAYATIAGLPVQVGLYTALVPMVVYAFIGSSRPLSVSTTTTIAILAGAELARVAPGAGAAELIAASATLAVLVGAILLTAAALRLGFVANFISESVLTGFKAGIGVVILLDQAPKLLGVHIEKTGFFRDVAAVLGQVPDASGVTVLLALALFALILLLERYAPWAPAPLVALAAAIGVSGALGLGLATVGEVPRELPQLVLPERSLIVQMLPAAAGIALMSFAETIAVARAFAAPGEPRLAPNRELAATGLGNVAGGLLGAMPSGGGASQTALNRRAGAKSQTAARVTAAVTLATLLLLAPLISLMPQAALAAVVVAYSIGLIQPAEFLEIRRVRRTEFRWALIAFAGVLLLGTLEGILVAVVASLLVIAQQAYDPPVHVVGRKRGTDVFRPRSPEYPDDETWPGLLILRPEGRLFFANAPVIADKMRALYDAARPSVVLLDFRAVLDLEYTALKMLAEAEERLRGEGVELWLAGLNPEALAVVRNSKLGERLGRERMFFNVGGAVQRYESRRRTDEAQGVRQGA
jgi:high affinity sulfate transporter 1